MILVELPSTGYIYKGERGKLCEQRGIQSQGELLLTRDQARLAECATCGNARHD